MPVRPVLDRYSSPRVGRAERWRHGWAGPAAANAARRSWPNSARLANDLECAKLEAEHNGNRLFLWSGRTQLLIRERLHRDLPELPAFDRKRPEVHLTALAQGLAEIGAMDELQALARDHRMPQLLDVAQTADAAAAPETAVGATLTGAPASAGSSPARSAAARKRARS